MHSRSEGTGPSVGSILLTLEGRLIEILLLVVLGVVERHHRGRLDDLHSEMAGHIRKLHGFDEPAVNCVEPIHVGADDFQEVINITAHAMDFDDLRNARYRHGKLIQPCLAVVACFHADESGHVEVDGISIENDDLLLDHAAVFEPLEPPPAGRWAQPHLIGQVSRADIRILLYDAKDFSVDVIHVLPIS